MLEITGKTNIDYIEVNLLEHNIKMLQRIKAAYEAKEETDLTGGQRKKQDESCDNSDNGMKGNSVDFVLHGSIVVPVASRRGNLWVKLKWTAELP